MCLVNARLEPGQAVWFIICQNFIYFVGFSYLSVLIQYVGYSERTCAIVFISLEDREVLSHRLSERLLLFVNVSSSESARAVAWVCEPNPSIRIISIAGLLSRLKLVKRLLGQSKLLQQHRFKANNISWHTVAASFNVILECLVDIAKWSTDITTLLLNQTES